MDQKRNILIVDDNEVFLKMAVLKIGNSYKEGNFITAKSGREALEILQKKSIDLLITDVYMPGMNGFQLLIRARRLIPGLKVIMMTAYYSQELHERAFNYGSLAYIEKPFKVESMCELLRRSFDEGRKKFTGEMQGIEISDIIQLNCIAKLNNVVQIDCHGNKGSIYFEKGEIVHASYNGVEGEEALKEILIFDSGYFSTKKITNSPKKTIFKNWQQLLLELMVSIDESRGGVKVSRNLIYVEDREDSQAKTKGSGGKTRVLVVDDSKISTKLLINILASDKGLDIIGDAGNGKEALALVKKLRPDVITVDMQMPLMDGITFLKKIMSERPTPVVVISGSSEDDEIKKECMDYGAVDFIHKSDIKDALKDETCRREFIDRIKDSAKASKEKLLEVRRGSTVETNGSL